MIDDKLQAPFYSGDSMLRTFFPADWLVFEKIVFSSLQKGDVVIFRWQAEKRLVHRVVHIKNEGMVTRGDHNLKPDEKLLTEADLIGRVTHYVRKGKKRRVWNGRLGLMRARVLHGRLHIIRTAKFFLRKPYRMIKKTGMVSKLWRPKIETIYFETQDGPLVKYIHKGRTVASCWTDSNRWWFRRPYDFVIGPKVK